MACEQNPANNRQTRMLALFDSEFNECSTNRNNIEAIDQEDYDEELLTRAKRTLNSMIFFAINEQQAASRFLFERELSSKEDFKFDVGLKQLNSIADSFYGKFRLEKEHTIEQIKNINKLDLKLYEYAVGLFLEKIKHYNLETELVIN